MKKLFILTLTVFTLFSCSSDEDSSVDPIIGTWYLFAVDNVEVSDCRKQTRHIFNSNGTSSRTVFDDNQPCSSRPTENSRWENLGNNEYQFTYPNGDIDTFTLTFSDNNNTAKGGDSTLKRIN